MKTTLFFLVFILCSCISVNAEDDISASVDINALGAIAPDSITKISSIINDKTISYVATRNVDVSDKLKKFVDNTISVGYTVSIRSNTLTTLNSTFASVQHFSVKLVSHNDELAIIDHTLTDEEHTSASINITPDVSANDIKQMLTSGTIQMMVIITGNVTDSIPVMYNDTIIIHVTAHVNTSL